MAALSWRLGDVLVKVGRTLADLQAPQRLHAGTIRFELSALSLIHI